MKNKKIKIYFVTENGVQEYQKEKHAKNVYAFHFWETTPLLIAGDASCDNYFHMQYEKLLEYFQKSGRKIPVQKPSGAGHYHSRNNPPEIIWGWGEYLLTGETPERLRLIILDALGLKLI